MSVRFQAVVARHVGPVARLGPLLLGLRRHGGDPPDAGLLARAGGARGLAGAAPMECARGASRRRRRQYVSSHAIRFAVVL